MKTLKNLFLGTALTLAGCEFGNNLEYHFNGKIGEEQVNFYEADFGRFNILEIVKVDGNRVQYTDSDNDLELNWIFYEKSNRQYFFEPYESSKDTLFQKVQKQFDDYLKKIKLENLK